MKKKFLTKILEIPEEIISNENKCTIIGFKKMLIENYQAILDYQDFYIRIKLYSGILNISGKNMKLNEINSDDICVLGNINCIEFEELDINKEIV